jgi:hypothetical protein
MTYYCVVLVKPGWLCIYQKWYQNIPARWCRSLSENLFWWTVTHFVIIKSVVEFLSCQGWMISGLCLNFFGSFCSCLFGWWSLIRNFVVSWLVCSHLGLEPPSTICCCYLILIITDIWEIVLWILIRSIECAIRCLGVWFIGESAFIVFCL